MPATLLMSRDEISLASKFDENYAGSKGNQTLNLTAAWDLELDLKAPLATNNYPKW